MRAISNFIKVNRTFLHRSTGCNIDAKKLFKALKRVNHFVYETGERNI